MVYFSLMRLYEFEAAELFRKEGIIVPPYAIADSPAEAKEKAREVGLPVILKAQVLTGGRYLAGGVQTADSLEEVEEVTRRILGTTIGGMAVPCVMVVRKIAAERQFYLGITLNAYQGMPVAILSTEGGVSVTTVVREHPEWMASRNIPITSGLSLYEAKQMAHDIGLRLGTGATLERLRRLRSGPFRLADAVTLDVVAQSDIAARIRPLEALLTDWPAVGLTHEGAEWASHGRHVGPAQCANAPAGLPAGSRVRFLGPDGSLVAVGEAGPGGVLHPAVVLM